MPFLRENFVNLPKKAQSPNAEAIAALDFKGAAGSLSKVMKTDWRSLRTLSASGDPPSWTQSKTANLAAATCSAHFPRLSAFSTISTEKKN